MTRSKATAVGFVAVLLWALLALLTVGSAPTPPLLLNAICFTIGGTLGLIWTLRTGGLGQLRDISWKVYAFGSLKDSQTLVAAMDTNHDENVSM